MQASKGQPQPGPLDGFMIWLMPRMTPGHVRLYRALGGRLVNRTTAGGPVLLLTTVGRKSGEKRTVALGYLELDDSVVVVGSNGGKPADPSWVLNVRSNPTVAVEIGRTRFEAEAELLAGDEREELWAAYTEAYPPYAEAAEWSGRTFDVYRLRRPRDGANGDG